MKRHLHSCLVTMLALLFTNFSQGQSLLLSSSGINSYVIIAAEVASDGGTLEEGLTDCEETMTMDDPTTPTDPSAIIGSDDVTSDSTDLTKAATDEAGLIGACVEKISFMPVLPADFSVEVGPGCVGTVSWTEPTYSLTCSGFTGAYDASNWVLSNDPDGDGTVDASGAPDVVSLTGSDVATMSGDNTDTDLCITIVSDGTLSFDWSAVVSGSGQLINDEPAYVLNGAETQLNTMGSPPGTGVSMESGSVTSLPVSQGDIFCFRVKSNNLAAVTTADFSNFEVVNTQIDRVPGIVNGSDQPLGTYVIGYEVTDCDGILSTSTFEVTVEDTQAPVITQCADPVMATTTGNIDCEVEVPDLSSMTGLVATDACPVVFVSQSPAAGELNTGTPDGGTFTVTLTIGDDASDPSGGNTTTCDVEVTVEDVDAPVVTTLADEVMASATGDADCLASVPDVSGLVGLEATDNCSGFSFVSQNPAAGTTIATGGHDSTFDIDVVIGDGATAQNTASTTVSVRVADVTAPVIGTCIPDATVQVCDVTSLISTYAPAGASMSPAQFASLGGEVSDNCDQALEINYTDVLITDMPRLQEIERTYTVTDDAGLTDECVQMISVTPILPADFSVEVGPGCEGTVSWTEPTYSLTCSGFTGAYDASNWVLSNDPDGDGTVDASGAPAAVSLTGSDDATMSGDNTDTDLCITIVSDGTLSFDWSAVAAGGGEQLINDEPAFVLNDVETQLNTMGVPPGTDVSMESGSVTALAVSQGDMFCLRVKSNNAGAVTTVDFSNFEVVNTQIDRVPGIVNGSDQPLGTYVIGYEVTDCDGMTNTCTFEVTVEDTQAPDLSCPADMTVQLAPFMCDTMLTFDVVADDACLPVTINQLDMTGLDSGDQFPIGTTTLTYEASDDSGNSSSCSFDIEVVEFVPVGLACQEKINFSLDPETCTGELTPDMVLTDQANGCLDNCTIVRLNNDGSESPAFFDFNDIDKTFHYRICCGGICCEGEVLVEDKFSPQIEVDDMDVFCNQLVPAATPDPSFVRLIEGCSGAVIELVSETMETIDCDPMYTGRVIRRYRAVGENGMVSPTVTQTILIRRLQQSSISFPTNRMLSLGNPLSCDSGFATDDNGNPLPSAGSEVGVPMMAGEPIFPLEDGIICSGYVEYRDNVIADEACVKKIMRTWEVGEWWCGGTTPRIGVQIIEIVDTTGPTLQPLPDITVSTGGQACSAMVNLPAVQATDNCNSPARYTVTYGGPILHTNGGLVELTDATEVTYTVYDDCDNSSTTSFMVTVVDEAYPVALCERWTNVPIAIGDTRVPAFAFDDGSFDECGPVTYEVARLTDGCGQMAGVFQDSVTFCCQDAGDTISVQLRVTDLGGLQNTCTVFAIIDDKVPPIVTCPADTTVECGFTFDPDRLSDFFGNPTVVDNCGSNVRFEDSIEGELDNCGLGQLTRTINVFDGNQLIRRCTQTITYAGGDVFDPTSIVWPRDTTIVGGVCDSATIHPDNLLDGYNEPTFDIPSCGQVGFGYEDRPFISADPADSSACIKVLRHWTIIDWCGQDLNGQYIIYDATQVLKIMPSTTNNRVAVAGSIATEDGSPIAGVGVEMMGVESKYDMTASGGDYAFPDMPMHGTYEVVPTLDEDHGNGVSTLDLVLMQRHILGLSPLSTPYQRIAADVTGDQRITGADIVELRRLVLGSINEFEDNTSWRFVDGSYVFPDESDPWLETFPEDYFIGDLTGDMTIDFVGLKVGDINGSADHLQHSGRSLDTRSGYVSIAMEDQYVVAGQVVEIPVLAATSGTLYGWQYALRADGLTINATIPRKARLTPNYTQRIATGIKVAYDYAEGLEVEAGDVLYVITAVAQGSGRLSDMINLDQEALSAEVYTGSELTARNASLEWRTPAYELEAFKVEQNKPNPWSDQTQIDFSIPESGRVAVRVYDLTGRLVRSEVGNYPAGHNTVTLLKEDLGSTGVLTYEVEYEDKVEVRKMILLD